ncbi:hypothetical protein BKA70DRAFT_1358155, partial [Coprinopsis sp. MPI-PUGE-AT-0042]
LKTQPQSSSFGFPSQQQQESISLNSNTNNLNADPNSTILFAPKTWHMLNGRSCACRHLPRQALDGVQNAYHVGYSPKQLQVPLTALVDTLRQSGSTPPPSAQTPTATMLTPTATASGTTPASTTTGLAKPTLLQIATKQVQVLYEQLKAKQENAGVVANLLGVVSADSSQGRR